MISAPPARHAAPSALCAKPNAEPHLMKPSTFDIPPDAVPGGSFQDVRVIVSLDATGRVVKARFYAHSHAPKLDAAVLRAAATSSYGPKIAGCRPVPSNYFYIVQYGTPPKVPASIK